MIILDSYAVIALLKGEAAAGQVRQLMVANEEVCLTVLGLAEVLDHLIRLAGAEEDEAVLDVAQLGLAPPVPVGAAIGMRAGLLRARHYHRSDRAVSLADCVAAEIARPVGSSLATADPHLLDLCQEEGITTLPLPPSTGNTWSP
ncbi:MAG: PIN domain-containing protein [Candidatus Dormibacteria bacterium]